MSIESTLEELVSAVRELNATIKAAGGKPQQEASPKAEGKQSSAKDQKAAASQPTAAAKETAPAAAPEKAESSEKPAPALDFDKDVAPIFKQFVGKKGREAALEFINGYKKGASRLSEAVKPEQYAEVVAKLKEALS